MLNLDILVWGGLLLAVALLAGLWFRLFMYVQVSHRGRRPRTTAKIIPIDSYRRRKTRYRNFG